MAKDKKMILIFPPQWTPLSPHYAILALMGQLKKEGYNASFMDLNVEFFDKILNSKFISLMQRKIKKDYVDLFNQVKNLYGKHKKEEQFTLEEKCKIYKYDKLKKFFEEGDRYYEIVGDLVLFAVNVIKQEERFYTPEHLIKAMRVIDSCLRLVSLAYAPNRLEFDNLSNPFLKFNFESIKHFVFDRDSNLFWDFYLPQIEKIKAQNPEFVAISLNSSSQIIPGLTLTYLLKKYTKAHINIGGNFFGRVKDALLSRPEFSIFCDSISIEEGEGPIIEMARFVNGEIPIEKVPNLVWFKNNNAYFNEKMKPVKLNDVANLNLDDVDLKKYYTPHIVLPYQTSRGCYWGKCTFCDQDFGQEFNIKNVDKVIFELKELKKKYGITRYEFIDESVSPKYMQELSLELLKTNINPSYFCDARLETQFDEEVLNLASKSGLKMIMWGVESGSKKIMESINKGIDLEKRFEILKMANEAGIWNFAFIFFGYPLETMDDARQTIKMLCDNCDIINSYGRSVFTMGKHAKIAIEPEKFGITKLYPVQDEFSPSIEFDSVGMNKKELSLILEECRDKCFEHYKNPLWMFLRYREWLFLYIEKYGLDWVSKYSPKFEECENNEF